MLVATFVMLRSLYEPHALMRLHFRLCLRLRSRLCLRGLAQHSPFKRASASHSRLHP
jgi:hypothetical protein